VPQGEWPGYTHAYWPTHDFDEQQIRDGWAFARQGRGYLALAAASGFELVHRGLGAFRELRAPGCQNVWLCMMGREDTDGTFVEFQQAVLSLDVDLRKQGVSCTTLRGEEISFGWTGPFQVSGQSVSLAGFKRFESPYCVAELGASELDIQYNDYTMRLDFG
jgi:hypothetical protein